MNRTLRLLFVCLLQAVWAVASAYNLKVEATPHGACSLNTSGGDYDEGSRVYLRTYGNTGYVFKGWYKGDEVISSSASFYYTMPAEDVVLQARYEYDPAVPADPAMPDTTKRYKLTLGITPNGAGSLNTSGGTYAEGANVSLSAYVNTGYHFTGWTDEEGNTLSTSTSYSYTMPGRNVHLTANYYYDPSVPANPDSMATNYTVLVKCKPVGGGSFNTSSTTASEGSSVRLYSYTNTGYIFKHWEDSEGKVLSTAQNFYYTIPHGNSVVYGVFEYDPPVPSNPGKNYWNKELGEVIVDDFSAGSLGNAVSTVIGNSSRDDVAMITVAGKMNDNDFGIANNYTNCTLLDLSRVTGITTVPSYAFDYTNLESVYLPASVETIGYRAFYECKQLSSLTVYAMVPPAVENYAFSGIPEGLVVYVPASSISQYQEAEGWKNFTFLPIQEDIRNVTISLPEGTDASVYAQMWLELTNRKSGQRMHFVMTDRSSYTFANIIRNTSWNAVIRNQRGDVFGKIDAIDVTDEDVTIAFESLQLPQNVTLTVKDAEGKDVTADTQITWTDAAGNYLSQSYSVNGLLPGNKLGYNIVLSQNLAMAYAAPSLTEYTVTDNDNNIVCTLSPLQKVVVSGKVIDLTTKSAISGAVVSASQTFGGKYSKTTNVKTDAKGQYSIEVFRVPTSLAIAASDYISQTMDCDVINADGENVSVADVSLKSITGATISVGFTYTTVVGETQNWYSDYQNVSYTLYNSTREKPITQFNVQYPQIVLIEEVKDGDVLRLTATSRTNAFKAVEATATIADQRAEAIFAITELGRIEASFSKTGNASVVGSLYDASGKLVKTYNYSEAKLTISDLADGNYTLVSMGSSRLFNTIYDLAQLPQTGLAEGTDYVQNAVEVKSGAISQISIDEVPTLDESKLYYTGDNTSFTVNKPSIVAGNYLTLTGRIDFKPAYATSVSNVQMIVDLPESCVFVENSVMVGNSTSSYTLNGHQITIPMARYTDRVRFCIIPTLGGEYAPSAFVQFDLNGETVTQPIGSANYTAKDLSISVPSTVAKTTIPVSGTAIGRSEVEIYDNGVLIGQTISLANGTWATTCELTNSYNLSRHQIYAKVTTKQGVKLTTENTSCVYDMNAIQISKVTMINTAHPSNSLELCEYVTVFDFINPKSSIPAYWYWPSYPQFTFIVDFTNNDPNKVSEVVLYVHTDASQIVELRPEYDAKLDKWVAYHDFPSNNLPANVSLDFVANSDVLGDSKQAKDAIEQCDDALAEDNLLRDLIDEMKSSNYSSESLFDKLFDYLNVSNEQQEEIPDNISMFLDEIIQSNNCSEFEYVSGVMKIRDEEGNIITAKNTTLAEEELTVDDLKDFYHVPLTDGSNIYLQINRDMVNVVYDGRMFSFGISNDINTEMTKMARAISSDEYFTRWSQFKATLDGLNYLSKKNSIIANVKDFLLGGLNKLKTELHQCREIKFAYSAGGLTPQQLKDLDVNKLEDCLSNLPVQIQKVEHSIARLNALFKLIDIASVINDINKAIDSRRSWNEIINNIESVDCWEMVDLSSKAKSHRQAVAIGYTTNIATNVATCVGADKLLGFVAMASGALGATASSLSMATMMEICGVISAAVTDFVIIQGGLNEWNDIRWQGDIRLKIPVLKGKCNDDDDDNGGGDDGGNGGGDGGNGGGDGGNGGGDGGNGGGDGGNGGGDGGNGGGDGGNGGGDGGNGGGDGGNGGGNGGNGGGNGGNGGGNGGNNGNGGSHHSGNGDVPNVKDPSGYVYEGVSSNRLEGVTATAYYKETVEDMYGDKHENIVKWDAAEYAQENPLFTDEYGMYAWDVPNGLWQVKFEKEGYETTYSEWLPVPPPQLDINIAMKQNVQPTVKSARAFEDAVEMEFDKYMMPEQLTTDNIRVMAGETAVEGTVELLNEEVSYEGNEEKFASKVRFNAAAPFDATEVTLMVSNRVKSYAGIRMQDDFSQTFTIEPEVQKIVCDAEASIEYGGQGELTVQVLPAVASAGKTLKVKSSSAMILSTDVEELILDNEGKASLKVGGELPGAAAITYTIDGYDLSATTMVSVEQVQLVPEKPLASIASGSALLKGTQITLSCPTSSAEIYYTTDGSCPCDAGAKKYDGTPITISEGTTLKIMAKGKKGDESEIVTYTYTLRQTNLNVPLAKGWNWVSHNQDVALTSDKLEMDNVDRVLTQIGELYRDPKIGFTGHIDDVNATDAFKVHTTDTGNLQLGGVMYNPYFSPVELKRGWNWLGYPLEKPMTVDDAFSLMESEANDYIVNLEGGFAQFDGDNWTGTLETLTPGQGYLFKSASDKELAYNIFAAAAPSANAASVIPSDDMPWQYDSHAYPNVMCVTADLYVKDVKAVAGEYLVGAFVDGECRGVGQYVDNTLFLSVHGDKNVEMTLLAMDNESGVVYDITEKLMFTPDVVGSVSMPYPLHVGSPTGISHITMGISGFKSIHNVLGQKVKSIDRGGVFIIDGRKRVVTKRNEQEYLK